MAKQATRRPKLSSDAATKAIAEVIAEGGSAHPRAHRLGTDWRGFLRDEFELTKEQEQELAGLDREEAQKIQGAFMSALEGGAEIKLKLDEPAELEISVRSFTKDDDVVGGIIFHCHTAKRLRDWKCHWGRPEDPPGAPPGSQPSGPLSPT